ncbi:MAG: YfhO family protein, partial [Anaerolineales bacterium]
MMPSNQTEAISRSYYSKIVRFWPLLIPIIIILPGISEFPYPSEEALFSDITIAHYPYTLFLKKSLFEQGLVPLWSPLILSGHPFAANPLSGLWYPPGWLALLLPLPLGFNILVILHILWGGIGMYLLVRAEGVTYKPALFAAIAFESLPKLYSHYGAGHLTLLYAVPWTPWLLLIANRKIIEGAKSFFQQGIIFSLIILADIRWAIYAGAIWWGYYLWKHIKGLDDKKNANVKKSQSKKYPIFGLNISIWKKISSFGVAISKLLTQTVLALILSAPLILPLLEYVQLSTRSNLSQEEVLTYSLPPARLLGLIFPVFGGFHEWMLYPGAAVVVVSVVFLMFKKHSYHSKFYFWMAVFTLILSLGSYIPGISYIAGIPVFNLLRVPSRNLFLFGIVGILYSVHGIDFLMKDQLDKKEKRRIFLALTAIVFFVIVLGLGVALVTGGLPLNFVWGSVAIFVLSVWLFLLLSHIIPAQIWFLGLIGLGLFDWGIVNWFSFATRSKEEVLSERNALASYLSEKEGRFRIYSPSYSVPQHIASSYDLEL